MNQIIPITRKLLVVIFTFGLSVCIQGNISPGNPAETGAVNLSMVSAGTASADQTICEGTQPSSLQLTGSTGSIQWQVFTIVSGQWTNISGATSSTLSEAQMGILTATTFYRAVVTNGGTFNSNMITITVNSNGDPIAPTVGNGTTIPYEISKFGHLRWVSEDPSRWGYNYLQTSNINASPTSSECYDNLEGWNPIGNSATPFTGIYDGGEYKISYLHINRNESFQGLFGEARGGELKNLRILSCDLNAKHAVGALAGKVAGVEVTNCHSSGSIDVTESGTGWSSTGGLIGEVHDNETIPSVINQCSSSANVTSEMNGIGGLIGVLGGDGSCTVRNSFASGNITVLNATGSRAGGLVGLVLNASNIEDCYAKGNISANENVGGLVGLLTGTVHRSYSIGQVTGSTNSGGLIGATAGTAAVNNSFWNTQTSGETTSAGGTGEITANLNNLDIFLNAGWDFPCETENGIDNIWGKNSTDNSQYPFLGWQNFEHEGNYSAGIVSADQQVCAIADLMPITLSFYQGEIQWQHSTDNETYEDIPGANADTLDFVALGYTDHAWFRAVVSEADCGETSDPVSIAVYAPDSSVVDTTACDSLVFHEMVYESTGQYVQTIPTVGGCDSTVTLNVTIIHSSHHELSVTTCDEFMLNDQTYTSSGIFEQTLTNAAGCDSVVVLNLTILESTSHTIFETACNSFVTPDGQVVTESGEYVVNYTNSVGCDSVLTIDLTIQENNTAIETSFTMATLGFANGSATVSVTGDQGPYSYQWNDPFMQTTASSLGLFPGTYICTITDSFGCQSQVQVLVPLVTGVPDTKVTDSYCNTTGHNLSDFISCVAVQNAEIYRWEFVAQGGDPLPELNRQGNPHLRLQWMEGIELGTTYDVRVKARVDGQWGDYDAVCTITTAIIVPTTEVRPEYHPTNLKGAPYELCDMVSAYGVVGATNYKWTFDADEIADNGNEIVYTRGSGNATVRLSWVNGLAPLIDYQVSVSVAIGNEWSEFGTAHTLTLGAVSAPALREGYCGANYAPNGYIMSHTACDADYYQFEFAPVGGGGVSTLTSANYIAMLNNASPALSSGDYNVRVKTSQAGFVGEYGPSCTITINGSGMQPEVQQPVMHKIGAADMSVGLYPNPNSGDQLRIAMDDLKDDVQEVNISIFNLQGAVVTNKSFGNQGHRLNHVLSFESALAKGMYLVKISINNEPVATERLVVQ